MTPESIAEMIESSDYVSTIAEVDSHSVGFAMAQISKAYVFAAFFKPAFEGQGIGKALMEATETGLRSAGVTEVWLSTGADPNLRAVGFYRNSG